MRSLGSVINMRCRHLHYTLYRGVAEITLSDIGSEAHPWEQIHSDRQRHLSAAGA